MVTSEVVDDRSETPKFPCLMKGNVTGVIVLFTENKKGTVVHVPKPDKTSIVFGEYLDEWAMEHFEPFYGMVKLNGR